MTDEKYLQFKSFIKEYVTKRKTDLKNQINNLIQTRNITPSLLIIQIGDNFASNKYITGKIKDCHEVGIQAHLEKFEETVSEATVLDYINKSENNYNGLIVQLPLPKHISVDKIIKQIPAEIDVDGFKPESEFTPCTPLGIYNLLMEIAKDDPKLSGQNIVILGRSDIVGKPMAKLLIEKTNATVTICNSYTKNLHNYTQNANILISAIGKAKYIKENMIKPDSIVIDVGINQSEDGKICGDIDYASIPENIRFITPVPGGVGLLTRLTLLENVYQATTNQTLHN